MAIRFAVDREVQIISLSDAIEETEAAAIRFKLEEKINQGRNRVVFDLAKFAITNVDSLQRLLGLVNYSVTRGALTACAGIAAEQWPLLTPTGKKAFDIYFSVHEAVDNILKKELPEETLKKTLSASLGKPDEAKSKALKELLKRYEVYQKSDAEDPFRLEFFIQQYEINKDPEALEAERRATDALEENFKVSQALEKECVTLANDLKAMTMMRKQPLGEQEIQVQKKSLETKIEEALKKSQALQGEIKKIENEIQKSEAGFQTKDTELKRQTQDLDNKIKVAEQDILDTEARLKQQEAQENATLKQLQGGG